MSSRWRVEPVRARPADSDTLRALALVPLIGFAVFSQLDAVANRLSDGFPVSLTEIALGGTIAAAGLVLAWPAPGRSQAAAGSLVPRLMLALFSWALFSWTLSAHHREGLDYLVKLATAVGPALCLFVIADRPWHLRALLWAIVAAGAVSAAIVLVESRTGTRLVSRALAAVTADFEGVARSAGGSDQNPTTAAQMLLVSTLVAAGWLAAGARRLRLLLAAAAVLGIVALVMMSARSALLGLIAGLALIALFFRRHRAFPLVVAAGLVAGLAAIPFLPPTLIDRFTAIGHFAQDPTLFRRVTYLRIGADLIAGSPLWGVGPGNFPLYYVTDAYRYLPGRELFPRELHNSYLDTATEYGLVGFALFAALLVACARAVRAGMAADDAGLARMSRAVAVALAGLLVACFFMPHKDLRYLWLMLALAAQCGRLRACREGRP